MSGIMRSMGQVVHCAGIQVSRYPGIQVSEVAKGQSAGATITTCSPLSSTCGTCLTHTSTFRCTFTTLVKLSPTLSSLGPSLLSTSATPWPRAGTFLLRLLQVGADYRWREGGGGKEEEGEEREKTEEREEEATPGELLLHVSEGEVPVLVEGGQEPWARDGGEPVPAPAPAPAPAPPLADLWLCL